MAVSNIRGHSISERSNSEADPRAPRAGAGDGDGDGDGDGEASSTAAPTLQSGHAPSVPLAPSLGSGSPSEVAPATSDGPQVVGKGWVELRATPQPDGPAVTGGESRFARPAEWCARLRTQDPVALQRALFDLAQAWPYQPETERAALLATLLRHEARRRPRLAVAWVEGLFRVGGGEVEAALLAHAGGDEGTAASRALARRRGEEMRDERAARKALAEVAASGPGEVTAAVRDLLDLPAAHGFGDGVEEDRDLTLTPEALCAQLEGVDGAAKRAALIAGGVAPILATDCDGTTWKHDIGEALFARAVRDRLLLPAAHPPLIDLLERFGYAASADVNADAATLLHAFESGELLDRGRALGLSDAEVTATYYAANVWCFAGHSVAAMKRWGRELFEGEAGFRGKLFAGLAEVLATARDQGFIPYAVSASNQWIVEVGAEYLGIPPWRVAGIQTAVVDGVITAQLRLPVTYGGGKVEAVRALIGGRAAIAMGDSVDATDRELLESALLRLAVEPKDARRGFVVARGDDNWRFVDYRQTRDGEAADTFDPTEPTDTFDPTEPAP